MKGARGGGEDQGLDGPDLGTPTRSHSTVGKLRCGMLHNVYQGALPYTYLVRVGQRHADLCHAVPLQEVAAAEGAPSEGQCWGGREQGPGERVVGGRMHGSDRRLRVLE